jgi:hypothetical protein
MRIGGERLRGEIEKKRGDNEMKREDDNDWRGDEMSHPGEDDVGIVERKGTIESTVQY